MSKHARWPVTVFTIGLCLEVAGFAWIHDSLRTASDAVRIEIQIAVFISVLLLGAAATFVGGVMWARQASNEAIFLAVSLIGLILFVIFNFVRISFDDGLVLVMPLGILLALALIISRAASHRSPS
jgi:hypothetical protein